jgi:hypothetical protein
VVVFQEPRDVERLIQVDVITDYDDSGRIIGIEILSPGFHAKDNIFDNFNWEHLNNATAMHFSFDKANDAFYLSIVPGLHSSDQRVNPGRLILNSRKELVSIEVMLPAEAE